MIGSAREVVVDVPHLSPAEAAHLARAVEMRCDVDLIAEAVGQAGGSAAIAVPAGHLLEVVAHLVLVQALVSGESPVEVLERVKRGMRHPDLRLEPGYEYPTTSP